MSGPEHNAEDPKETLTFEQIVVPLSSVVTQLEGGELPLEQGVALSRSGSKRLDAAERRIEVLLDGSERKTGIETRPFDAELDDE